MTPLMWVKIVGAGLVLALIAAATLRVVSLAETVGELKAESITLKSNVAALEAQGERLDTALTEKLRADTVIRDARASSRQSFEELKHEDPTVADWAGTRIPDRVRELDSPGAAGSESGRAD